MDYFVNNMDSFDEMSSFIIGRPVWDNWFIYHCRMNNNDVISATATITAVHQNHDYSHVLNGSGLSYNGHEADRNRLPKKYYLPLIV